MSPPVGSVMTEGERRSFLDRLLGRPTRVTVSPSIPPPAPDGPAAQAPRPPPPALRPERPRGRVRPRAGGTRGPPCSGGCATSRRPRPSSSIDDQGLVIGHDGDLTAEDVDDVAAHLALAFDLFERLSMLGTKAESVCAQYIPEGTWLTAVRLRPVDAPPLTVGHHRPAHAGARGPAPRARRLHAAASTRRRTRPRPRRRPPRRSRRAARRAAALPVESAALSPRGRHGQASRRGADGRTLERARRLAARRRERRGRARPEALRGAGGARDARGALADHLEGRSRRPRRAGARRAASTRSRRTPPGASSPTRGWRSPSWWTGGPTSRCPILHGRFGEDGTLQACLQVAGIRFAGSGVRGSATAVDKIRTKEVLAFHGVRTPRFRILGRDDLGRGRPALADDLVAQFGTPARREGPARRQQPRGAPLRRRAAGDARPRGAVAEGGAAPRRGVRARARAHRRRPRRPRAGTADGPAAGRAQAEVRAVLRLPREVRRRRAPSRSARRRCPRRSRRRAGPSRSRSTSGSGCAASRAPT